MAGRGAIRSPRARRKKRLLVKEAGHRMATSRPRRAIDRLFPVGPVSGPGARFGGWLRRMPGRRPEEVLTKSCRLGFS